MEVRISLNLFGPVGACMFKTNKILNYFVLYPVLKINALKEKGNEALASDKYDEAIAAYTEAIALDGENHVLFSNRSAAYAKASKYEEALKDAEQTIALNPTWPKGYSRKSAALTGMEKYSEALLSYKKGKTSVKLLQINLFETSFECRFGIRSK